MANSTNISRVQVFIHCESVICFSCFKDSALSINEAVLLLQAATMNNKPECWNHTLVADTIVSTKKVVSEHFRLLTKSN